MKKWIVVIIAILGIILTGFGISAKIKGAASVGIIGGADGPTAVFVAGNVGDLFSIGVIIVGIILVVAGAIIYRRIKK